MMQRPQTLQQVGQDRVLRGILAATQKLGAPFCAGGTLGRMPVRLAVAGEDGAAEIVELPGGAGALIDVAVPAPMGKGTETGACHQPANLLE